MCIRAHNEVLRHSGSQQEWCSTDRHEGAWGLRRRLRRGKFQLANIEEGNFVVIYRKHLLPDRDNGTGPIVLPISGASQPHLIVGMLPAERGQNRQQDFTQVLTFEW